MVIAKKKFKRSHMTANTNAMMKYMEYNRTSSPEQNNQDVGVARAIFIPHSNSLPFEERCITLEQPVKIGRNVYRATPSPTNTIFECRVLSRHHATLYYDKGHFYLVDNQSSNGTFINNNRCSISKDQEPHEVFSGDVVQFGIPVVENAGNTEKNTFPPVVALLKLYHPDGKEAKLSFNPTMTTPLHLKELYQLNNFVQEAIQREASLEARLRTLRECVERTRSEARASWELFVGEQRLLMRVHTLETMHSMGKQPDANQVAQLLNDKKNYQEVAQESLRAAHEQRLALEESLERRSREAAALHQHNCALRLAANNALAELQKLAARCERKMCAARLAIAAAEERELAVRNQLPLAYSVQNGEAKMLVVSSDSNKLLEAKRGASGTLEDAIRALPDYIKLLLPQHVINKVGIKVVSTDGKSGKEFELILKKNSIYNDETKATEKDVCEEGDVISDVGGEVGGVGSVGDTDQEQTVDPDVCTDDEKQSRLNHECPNETEASSRLDGELKADNNANSTYTDNETDESSSGVEYANILRVMAGLNEEIRALRERVSSIAAENDQLKTVRDELLAAREEREVLPADDACDYRATIADLQVQLTKSTAAEEANIVEIQRLSSNAAELEAQLAFRPTKADIDDLTNVVGKLQSELQAKDQQLRTLQQQLANATAEKIDRAVSTEDLIEAVVHDESTTLDPSKISAEIDEMFRLEYDEDDEESDSVATDINQSVVEDASEAPSQSSVKLDEEQRVMDGLENGGLIALEEELVRTKERWAEAAAERARLAQRLEQLQQKTPLGAIHVFALAVPLIAAALYYILLPYLS